MASIPDEVMYNILSFLPRKSLARFRCAHRLWYTLFLDPKFKSLYLQHSTRFLWDYSHWRYESEMMLRSIRDHIFCSKTESSDELLLEQTCSHVSPCRCRIYSPDLYQYLDFPGPQNLSLCYAIEFLPSHRAYKLVSAYEDENNQGGGLGYEVLHIGIDDHITPTTTSSFCWRPLKVPCPNNGNTTSGRKRKRSTDLYQMGLRCVQHEYHNKSAVREGLVLFFRKGVAYCIWSYDDEIYNANLFYVQVDVLDMANECNIGHTTLPRTSFPEQTSNIQLLDWNGQLSLAQIVRKDELHVFVLDDDDYINLNWTKRIIKLSFFSKHSSAIIQLINLVDNSTLYFSLWRGYDKSDLYRIDIDTGNVTIIYIA